MILCFYDFYNTLSCSSMTSPSSMVCCDHPSLIPSFHIIPRYSLCPTFGTNPQFSPQPLDRLNHPKSKYIPPWTNACMTELKLLHILYSFHLFSTFLELSSNMISKVILCIQQSSKNDHHIIIQLLKEPLPICSTIIRRLEGYHSSLNSKAPSVLFESPRIEESRYSVAESLMKEPKGWFGHQMLR